MGLASLKGWRVSAVEAIKLIFEIDHSMDLWAPSRLQEELSSHQYCREYGVLRTYFYSPVHKSILGPDFYYVLSGGTVIL